MKKIFLGIATVTSAVLLTGCVVTTTPNNTPYTDYTGYTGYTVNYNTGFGTDYRGMGTYRGYGGWASSYYAPGYRGGYWPQTYYGGRSFYRQGYVRHGGDWGRGWGGRGWRR